MRIIFSFIIFFGLTAAATTSEAANPLRNLPSGTLGIEAGDFSFFHYDGSEIDAQKLEEIFGRAEWDRDYFLEVINEINTAMDGLIQQVWMNELGLLRLSRQADPGGSFVSADDFIRAADDYIASTMFFRNRLEALTALSNGMFPSRIGLETGREPLLEDDEIPNYGNIAFEEIKSFYETRLEQLTDFIRNLPHRIEYRSGMLHEIPRDSGKGLVLEAEGYTLSREEIARLQREIRQSYILTNPDHYDAINDLTNFTRRRVQQFIQVYGTEERYRSQQVAGNEEAMITLANQIAEDFWVRSRVRALYGFPLGAIGVEYQTQWFHLETLFTRTRNLAQFINEPVRDEITLDRLERNYRQTLRIANLRASRITGSGRNQEEARRAEQRAWGSEDDLNEAILDGDVTFLSRMSSFGTYVAGNRPLADTLLMMLRLLAADLYEERLVMRPGGHREMFERYRARYMSTEENRSYSRALVDTYRPIMSQGEVSDDPFGGGIGGIAQNSFKWHLMNVVQALDAKEYEMNIARQNQRVLANAMRIGGDSPDANRRQQRQDLLDQ